MNRRKLGCKRGRSRKLRSAHYSQILHIKRLCTLQSDFEKNANLSISYFQVRGYPQSLLEKCYQQVSNRKRADLLKTRTKQKDTTCIPAVLTVDKDLTFIKETISSTLYIWPIVQFFLLEICQFLHTNLDKKSQVYITHAKFTKSIPSISGRTITNFVDESHHETFQWHP